MDIRSRPLIALALALLVAVLAWWLWPDPIRARASADALPAGRAETNPAVEKDATGRAVETPEADARTRGAVAAADEPAPIEGELEPATPLRTLSGTLRYFDPLGEVRPVLRGSFRLMSAEDDLTRRVSVEQGAWSVELHEGNFDIDEIVADGSRAFLHGTSYGSFRFPEDAHLDVLVRADLGFRLVVVDARSGLELRDLELRRELQAGRWAARSPIDLSPESLVAQHAVSPIEFQPAAGGETLFVRAPGFAWRATWIPRNAGSEQVVALHPGGRLSVVLSGAVAPAGAELRLRRLSGMDDPDLASHVAHARALEPRDRTLEFESIMTGTYEVSVEVGESVWRSSRLAAAQVEVLATEPARVELVLRAVESASLVPASGTILAPGEWLGVTGLQLDAKFTPHPGASASHRLAVTTVTAAGGERSLLWSCPAIEPGDYYAFVAGPGCFTELTIAPFARSDYVIALPEPASVRVRLVDAQSRAPAAVERVGWIGRGREWRPGGAFNGALHLDASGEWFFTAPVGEVSLWISDPSYAHVFRPFTLHAGENELEVELTRACGVKLSFVCVGAPVVRDLDWKIELQNADGSLATDVANPIDADEIELLLKAPGPGHYWLAVSGLDGYRSVARRPLDLAPGEFVRIAVELQRLR